MDVAVTGSSGLIGTALVDALGGRRPPGGARACGACRRATPSPGTRRRAPSTPPASRASSAVVHLAGAGIGDHRWNDAYKREIVDSRVQGTGLLARTLAGLSRPPAVLVSASAIGWYGDRGDEVLDETVRRRAPGSSPDVCRQWEAAADPARGRRHPRRPPALGHRPRRRRAAR